MRLSQNLQKTLVSDSATALAAVVEACKRVVAPCRGLDARIALAVFPGLADLEIVGAGIWVQADGTRVRALRYSSSLASAATLVPAGCWIDSDRRGMIVAGDHGEWIGVHGMDSIGLCIAALSARIAEIDHVG